MAAVVALAGVVGAQVASAQTPSPWWHLTSGARPSPLPAAVASEGKSGGEIVDTAINVGNASTSGEVKLLDTLPAGLGGVTASIVADGELGDDRPAGTCALHAPRTVECTLEGALAPFAQVEVRIGVIAEPGASTGEANEVSVSGGSAPPVAIERPIAIGGPVAFGVEDYELIPEEAGGSADTQAFSHPFQLTTTFTFAQSSSISTSQSISGPYEASPVALAKDLRLRFPAGLIGNPTELTQCAQSQFMTESCPGQAVVGVATTTIDEPGLLGLATFTTPVYNLEPNVGEPARFGFLPIKPAPPIFLNTSVRSGEDYGITVSIENITQVAAFDSGTVTLWGVPGAAGHDNQRGSACLQGKSSSCEAVQESEIPFLSMPASCTGPLQSAIEVDSWEAPGNFATGENIVSKPAAAMPPMDGCNQLPFHPSISVTPDVQEASKPSGLRVDLHVPAEDSASPEGLGESPLKELTIALPTGVTLNPAAANGLGTCSEGLAGYTGFGAPPGGSGSSGTRAATFTPTLPGGLGSSEALQAGVNFCANASKIGEATIRTPLLDGPIEGAVYLARESENPFGSLLALYIVGEDVTSGTVVKLAGDVSLNQATGQITVTFQGTPQLPLEDIELDFFGGVQALLATPARCGAYTTTASFTPWSQEPGEPPHTAFSTFDITTGPKTLSQPGGSPCPGGALPFTPSLVAGTTNLNAGSFIPLTATISREDGQQSLQSLRLRLPAGLSAMLAGVPLCAEAEANAGSCPAASEIGQTTVAAGVGGEPYTLAGGKVYLTGAYEGAPFGLAIETPVKAGPLDLEDAPENHPACDCLVIRARIEVDPQTAQLTIAAGGIPSIIDGIPLQIKHLEIAIDRAGFMFNPTSCAPMSIGGTIGGGEGGTAAVSSPFQIADCRNLKFTPKLTASTRANGEPVGHGASLHLAITTAATTGTSSSPFTSSSAGTTQANLRSLKLDLPKQLPTRLTTLQGACRKAVFAANPANCPASSVVGTAKAATPVLGVPMVGPAYFVSNGRESLPDIDIVLQGDGVGLNLRGSTFVSKEKVTSVTFRNLPDIPLRSFELSLPEGAHSALGTETHLCKQKLAMPAALTGQNGAVLHTSVKVGVTGCPPTRRKPRKAARGKGRKER